MNIVGWYYLHENNELIYKPSPDAAMDIRDSDFARHMWPIDPSNRAGAWDLLVEALSLGAKKSRIDELSSKWHCNDNDADVYANLAGVTIDKDGDKWCAKPPAFINLQESPAGFGGTKLEAMADLAKCIGFTAGLMWTQSFRELLQSNKAA